MCDAASTALDADVTGNRLTVVAACAAAGHVDRAQVAWAAVPSGVATPAQAVVYTSLVPSDQSFHQACLATQGVASDVWRAWAQWCVGVQKPGRALAVLEKGVVAMQGTGALLLLASADIAAAAKHLKVQAL